MYYFAYGSNMHIFRMLERDIIPLKTYRGLLLNYELVFNKVANLQKKIAYANIRRANTKEVRGALYEVTQRDINQLDMFEGYPTHYDRKLLTVWSDDIDDAVDAHVYIAKPNMTASGLKPTKDYLFHLIQGVRFIGRKKYLELKNMETAD